MNGAPGFLTVNRQSLFRFFFLSVFLFLLYQLLQILSPFVTPLVTAITLTMVFYPLHRRIGRRFERYPSFAAGLSTASILLIVIVPIILFAWVIIRDASVIYPAAQNWVKAVKELAGQPLDSQSFPPAASPIFSKLDRFLSYWEIDAGDIFLKNVDQIGNRISAFGTKAVKNLLFLAFDVMVMTFALFFFFRDGAKMTRWVLEMVPMEQSHKDSIMHRLDRTLSAVVRGMFLTATTQGVLAGAGFAVLHVKFPVLLGFGTAFLTMIPFFGAAVVWAPVALYLFLKGHVVRAILLVIWGTAVVSLVDNFMKPLLIGERAKLPVFLLFFGILGGLQVYGFMGVIIGPLMIASVLAFAKIYRDEFYHPAHKQEPGTIAPTLKN